jgi:DNA-binding response OmpR family regulator
MSGRSSGENEGSRLGGARADFVASLGRKVNDARDVLAALEDDPSSRSARDELRRRLHALGAGARLLRFDAMSHSLQEALAVLDRGALAGTLREPDVAFVAQVVDDLPALAWGEAPPREVPAKVAKATAATAATGAAGAVAAATEEADEAPGVMPIAVLVVGGESLAEALTEDAALRARAFECERTEEAQTALELARAYAPDVMLVDADLPQSSELVEALLDDPLTEPVPIVVVGSFRMADESARYVALGVAKALPKPVAPEVLRRTCDEILDAREGRTMRVTLGEPTLEQLADRLAEELKRALVESVDRPARSCRVPLGEGTEVLGALWGAIARVQEIVSQKTGGAVRFGGDAPEGAIALAPWLHHDVPASERAGARGRGAAADVRLHGRRVVVADDDPGVTWFISDLLRTAGCEVHEALDGISALALAFRVQPELVVSDILMPGLDGFALSRALHRDVALRDVPVILLSWKEDLLQRVRELGASAAAYMKKESDSRAILARVREVLRPRARIEMRLRGDGEIRGRLDGLTVRLLLELVGSVRKDARVAVRDASYLYEIEIRGGEPRKATRTASDGGYLSGERALASLLGVGAGRFVVSPSSAPIRGELTGTLFEQLARPLAAARGALAATTGARTMNVERIVLDEEGLEEYLRATPDPARGLVKRIARGASPRQMLLAGETSPSLMEDVLADLAARGAVRAVTGANGADFLTSAVEAALAVLRVSPQPARSLPPNARPSVPAAPVVMRARKPAVPRPAPRSEPRVPSRPDSRPEQRPAVSADGPESAGASPSSLEDAVMREISDRSPRPGAAHTTSEPPPLVEPSDLRPRSSHPPAEEVAGAPIEPTPLASIPPDAVVPASASGEEIAAAAAASTSAPRIDAPAAVAIEPRPALELVPETPEPEPAREPDPAPEPEPASESAWEPVSQSAWEPAPEPERKQEQEPEPEPEHDTATEARYVSPFAIPTQPLAFPGVPAPRLDRTLPLVAAPAGPAAYPYSTAAPTATAPAPAAAAPAKRTAWLFIVAFAVLGIAVGAVLHLQRTDRARAADPVSSAATSAPWPVASAPSSTSVVAPTGSVPPGASATASAHEDGDELPPGIDVPSDFGLVDVAAPPEARVRIDGAIAGAGPSVRLAAAPGYHEVRIEQDGHDSAQVVEVHPGKTTRVRSAPPP